MGAFVGGALDGNRSLDGDVVHTGSGVRLTGLWGERSGDDAGS